MDACVFIYIYIINIQYTHICEQKLLFWMQLITIKRLTALIKYEYKPIQIKKLFLVIIFYNSYYCFTAFYQINAALLSIILQNVKHKFLNGSVKM